MFASYHIRQQLEARGWLKKYQTANPASVRAVELKPEPKRAAPQGQEPKAVTDYDRYNLAQRRFLRALISR